MHHARLRDSVRACVAPELDHLVGPARQRWFAQRLTPVMGAWDTDAAQWLRLLRRLCAADGSFTGLGRPEGLHWLGHVVATSTRTLSRAGMQVRFAPAAAGGARWLGQDADDTVVLAVGPDDDGWVTTAASARAAGVPMLAANVRSLVRAHRQPEVLEVFVRADAEASLATWLARELPTVVADDGDWTPTALSRLARMGAQLPALVDALVAREVGILQAWRAPRAVVAGGLVVRLGDLPTALQGQVVAAVGFDAVLAEARALGIADLTADAVSEAPGCADAVPVDTAHVPELHDAIAAAVPAPQGTLMWCDNGAGLRRLAAQGPGAQCVYLDPPFNTGRTFDYRDRFSRSAWMAMLRERLRATRDVLAPSGSVWLHLDTHASHLGRVLLDEVFGEDAFVNEIVWQFGGKGLANAQRRLVPLHNTLHVAARDPAALVLDNRQHGTITASVRQRFGHVLDDDGRVTFGALARAREAREHRVHSARFVRQQGREPADDDVAVDYGGRGALYKTVWLGKDLPIVRTSDAEHTGFVTQKPERLLQRVVTIASGAGDLVVDPFAGSGTTLTVAHKLGRRWVGIESGDHAATTWSDGGTQRIGVLGRLKQVVAGCGVSEPSGISADLGWKGGGALVWERLAGPEAALAACAWTLQQGAGEQDVGHAEVDHQPGDVDERGDERGGG